MQTIQVVIDEKLLQATDRAARREKVNRSALIRNAVREHLKKLAIAELDEREREGYELKPQTAEEIFEWEQELAWPDE